MLAPVLFGTINLDSKAAAVPLEMLISTIGIILLVPIFQPEQDDEIKDIIASKYIDSTYIHFIRLTYTVIGIIVLVLIFSLFMLLCGCEITIALICGTIADAMFLGSIGLLTSAITGNLPVSFMASLSYYAINISLKSKLGNFNIFAMMNGNYKPNIYLFVASIIFMAISVLIKRELAKR